MSELDETPVLPIPHRVSVLEGQMQQVISQFNTLSQSVSQIDERTRKGELAQVKTQTLLEGLQRELSNVNGSFNRELSTVNNNVQKLVEAQQKTLQAITEEKIERTRESASQEVKQVKAAAEQETRQMTQWQKFWEGGFKTFVGWILTIGGTLAIAKWMHF